MAYYTGNRRSGKSHEDSKDELENIIESIISSDVLDVKKFYNIEKNRENIFQSIMKLYEETHPNWAADYIAIERKKPKNVRTYLSSFDMEDIIDSARGDDLLETALSVHAMNRIAHSCIFVKRKLISELIDEKKKATDGKFRISDRVFYNLEIDISRYFDPANKEDISTRKRVLGAIKRRGITEQDLDMLEKRGYREISEKQRSAFYIKDFLIDDLITLLKDRDDISYGMEEVTYSKENGSIGHDNVLVVDLPYYGQFSVHLKSKSSISALSDTPYDTLRVFEKEGNILTDGLSKIAERKLKEEGTLSIKQLKAIRRYDPRYAHYLAVKQGSTKQELDEMYEDDER